MSINKTVKLLVVTALALALCGCSTVGSGVQGVGSMFNKTGGAIKGLG